MNTRTLMHMKVAGDLAHKALEYACETAQHCDTTMQIEYRVRDFIKSIGGACACIGYNGYRHATCISVNDVAIHGIPNDKKLKPGDVISIDLVVEKNGHYGDTCRTIVYQCNEIAHDIVMDSRILVDDLIYLAGFDGITYNDLARRMISFAEKKGYALVTEFCGHGINTILHDSRIQTLGFETKENDKEIEIGDIFTIEPVLLELEGDTLVEVGDGWGYRTASGKLSAQHEHTVAKTARNKLEVLT